jgi:hypothetical protein
VPAGEVICGWGDAISDWGIELSERFRGLMPLGQALVLGS